MTGKETTSIMSKSRRKDSTNASNASPMPIYGSGNVLYSTSDSLTSEEIDNYFRIIPNSSKRSIESGEKAKHVEYLRPVSFEEQQREMEIYRKNRIEMNSNVTFYEKFDRAEMFCSNVRRLFVLSLFDSVSRKQMFPIDEKAYAKDYQQRFDDEFVQVSRSLC